MISHYKMPDMDRIKAAEIQTDMHGRKTN